MLKAKRPGVSARALAGQYGLEELRHYIERSRVAIDKLRGWEFSGHDRFSRKNHRRVTGVCLEKGGIDARRRSRESDKGWAPHETRGLGESVYL